MLRKALFAESFPFVITLFLGALAWYVTHYVDRLSVAPIVEYRISVSPNQKNIESVKVTLTNLTQTTAFRDLSFVLRTYEHKSRFEDPYIQVVPPAWEGGVQESQAAGQSAIFKLPQFQPNSRVELHATCVNCKAISLHLTSSESTILLLAPSWQTFFLRYEPILLGGILLLWALLLIVIGSEVNGNAKVDHHS